MASAVVAFMNVFQTDEPAGSYSDLDEADVFVTWGANMAEAHPMLYSRLTARKLSGEGVKHYDLGTIRTRTSASADKTMIFHPNTDLAIANCIANYLVSEKKYDEAFVNDHLQFKQGTEDIGNSFEDGYDKSEIGSKVDAVSPTPSSTPLSSPAWPSRTSRSWPRCSRIRTRRSCRCGPWA